MLLLVLVKNYYFHGKIAVFFYYSTFSFKNTVLIKKTYQLRVRLAYRGFRINFRIVCQRKVQFIQFDKLNFADVDLFERTLIIS